MADSSSAMRKQLTTTNGRAMDHVSPCLDQEWFVKPSDALLPFVEWQ